MGRSTVEVYGAHVLAIEVTAFGGPELLRLTEREAPTAGRGQVLVRVEAVGLNWSDILQRRGTYPGGPTPPFVSGQEAAGIVVARGHGVTSPPIGARVSIVGTGLGAGFVAVPADACIVWPADAAAEQRAALPIAVTMSRPMALLAKIAAPFVWLLDTSSNLLMRLLGMSHRGEARITAEELHMLFTEATRTGVIEEQERAIMSGVMRLADRPVRELMTPRIDLDWLDLAASEAEIRSAIAESPHSLLPVAEGTVDRIVGVVKVKELLAVMLAGEPVQLPALLRKAEVVPDQLDAMDALRTLQQSGLAMAMVHDEYGHLEGIVTPADLLAAIAGNFVSHQDEGDEPMLVEREDGSLLVSGALPADALAERLGLDLPEDREFATAAGYVLWVLKKLPLEGEIFTDQDWRFEVVDMDGRKIDKLLVSKAD